MQTILDNEPGDDLDEAERREHAEPGEQERPDARVQGADLGWAFDEFVAGFAAQPERQEHEADSQQHGHRDERGDEPRRRTARRPGRSRRS